MVDFTVSDELRELRSVVRQFLQSRSPESAVRELMATEAGYDPDVWKQMAEQLGLQGLTIPEQYGGQGFGYVELMVVLEEMGASLLCAPYFSTVVLAANALMHSGDDDAQALFLPGIASGETVATLAVTEPDGRWDLAGVQLTATPNNGVWRLDGTKTYVLDGHTADLVLVLARTERGISLFAVEGSAAGLRREALPAMDQTRKQAKLDFDNVGGILIGVDGGGSDLHRLVLDLAVAGLAAEQVGGTQRCLDMSVSYAKERYQFGRPIGSFQAIKHKCADMLLETESARSAAHYACWCASVLDEELPAAASLAKAYCSDAYFHVAAENIQIHGGIGFTWEHPAHLYFKRAKTSELLFGSPSYHRELLVQRISA